MALLIPDTSAQNFRSADDKMETSSDIHSQIGDADIQLEDAQDDHPDEIVDENMPDSASHRDEDNDMIDFSDEELHGPPPQDDPHKPSKHLVFTQCPDPEDDDASIPDVEITDADPNPEVFDPTDPNADSSAHNDSSASHQNSIVHDHPEDLLDSVDQSLSARQVDNVDKLSQAQIQTQPIKTDNHTSASTLVSATRQNKEGVSNDAPASRDTSSGGSANSSKSMPHDVIEGEPAKATPFTESKHHGNLSVVTTKKSFTSKLQGVVDNAAVDPEDELLDLEDEPEEDSHTSVESKADPAEFAAEPDPKSMDSMAGSKVEHDQTDSHQPSGNGESTEQLAQVLTDGLLKDDVGDAEPPPGSVPADDVEARAGHESVHVDFEEPPADYDEAAYDDFDESDSDHAYKDRYRYHPIVVSCEGDELSLFPNDVREHCLLSDDSLSNAHFKEIFAACRNCMGWSSDEFELEFDCPILGIRIYEVNLPCP